ncbi:MAG TPA: CpaF family protein [Stellaceae bacterium]|nr:CpaF family protein [Stellaceae bacterium]
MIKNRFGRRIIESEGRSLVSTPEAAPKPNEPSMVMAGLEEARERIRATLLSRIDPTVASRMAPPVLRAEILRLVGEIGNEERVQLNAREEDKLVQELLDDMIGLGPLEPLLQDELVTDIMVNGPNNVWVERHGKLEQVVLKFRDNQHVTNIAQRIAAAIGRRVDEASPLVDARLADGSRVNIVLPPLALCGPTLSIRKFPSRKITLDVMVRQGNISEALARFLEIAARSRLNMAISGGTGSGKTTLLNAVSRFIDPGERIITVEDAAELQLQQPHVVSLETRPPSLEGTGEVNQRDLVKNALRMRPDRIILGEIRDAAAFDMLQAMNTGHDGSMCTLHANTPRDALSRIENMVLMSGMGLPLRAIRTQIASALDVVVQIERMRDGVRRIQSVIEVVGLEGEIITTQDLFTFKWETENRDGSVRGSFQASRYRPRFLDRIEQAGLGRRFIELLEMEE